MRKLDVKTEAQRRELRELIKEGVVERKSCPCGCGARIQRGGPAFA